MRKLPLPVSFLGFEDTSLSYYASFFFVSHKILMAVLESRFHGFYLLLTMRLIHRRYFRPMLHLPCPSSWHAASMCSSQR